MTNIVRSAVLTFCACAATTVSADVFRDVLGYYCGGIDANGDGNVQASEIKDLRRVGSPDAVSHGVVSAKADYESANKWTTCDVELANAGTTLRAQRCIEFTTVYTNSSGTRRDGANGFALPFTEALGFGQTGKPYTIIIRFKPVEIEEEVGASGNPYTSDNNTLLYCGYNYNSAAGARIRIDNATQTIRYDCAKNAATAPTITNAIHSTRGSCWTEIAYRAPNAGGSSGARVDLFQPGGISRNGALNGNANGVEGGQLWIGCNNGTTAKNGFRGKVHMFAVWDRYLSDDEIAEAFSSDPTRDGKNFGEVNDPESASYVPGKPIFKFGNDDYGAEMFGGGTCSDSAAVDMNAFDARAFPSTFVAGSKVDFAVTLDKYQTNHANIIRFKAATKSASGVLRILSGGAEVDRCDVKPGEFASLLVASDALKEPDSTVTVECVEASDGGLVFDSVQFGGPWSWQIGENYSDLSGGSQGIRFVIGESSKTSWKRNLSGESVWTLSYDLPADIAGSFDFKFGFKVYSKNNCNNLWMRMNDCVIVTNGIIASTGGSITKGNVYPIPIRKKVFAEGVNTLSMQNYYPAGGNYFNPEYWFFEPVSHRRPSGLLLIFR